MPYTVSRVMIQLVFFPVWKKSGSKQCAGWLILHRLTLTLLTFAHSAHFCPLRPLCCRPWQQSPRGGEAGHSVLTACDIYRQSVNVIAIYAGSAVTSFTYDHRHWKARDPVRSPLVKPVIGGLVVGSVTTSEYPLLYVFFSFFFFPLLSLYFIQFLIEYIISLLFGLPV